MIRKYTGTLDSILFNGACKKGAGPLSRADAGLTLVETMIVLSLMLTVVVITAESLNRGRNFWLTSVTKSEQYLTGKRAMDLMEAELRNATLSGAGSPPNVTIGGGQTSVTFYLPTDIDSNGLIIDSAGDIEWDPGNPIQYFFDSAQNRLLRIEGGAQRLIATDVLSVTFDDISTDASLSLDELKINLSMQKTILQQRNINTAFVSTVRLRN